MGNARKGVGFARRVALSRRKALRERLSPELGWCMGIAAQGACLSGRELVTIDEQAAVLAGEKDPQFLHAVLCQLGLPRNPTLQRTFERRSGRASLRLQAGELFDGDRKSVV